VILILEEQSWRIKSKATWIKEGNRNSSFFHRFASHRKNVNTIWSISDDWGAIRDDWGTIHCSQLELKKEAFSFFKKLYDNPNNEYLMS